MVENNYFSYKILINVMLIFALISKNESKINKSNRIIFSNEIKIIIDGIGSQNVLNPGYSSRPDEIYVNGNHDNINEEDIFSNLENGENIIIMKWNNKLTNCDSMFKDLSNIIEIDLTKFDTSEVTTMQDMFNSCINLKKIIIDDNFNTSKVTSMASMFLKCMSLESLDLSNFITSSINNLGYFLSECNSLTTLNLSKFDTSLVRNMAGMFSQCILLVSLDLSNFNTINVINMAYLFLNCFSLTSINISSFNTSNCISMSQMFYSCHSLKSLNLSNFNTKSVFAMNAMFYDCKELKELNLSNFDTSSVQNFHSIFHGCNNLITLDISNFNMSQSVSKEKMFYDCKNLEYINFNNSIENSNSNFTNILYGVPDNLVYCSRNRENIYNIISNLKEMCIINDCSNNWKIKKKKFIKDKNICVNDCKEDNEYFYEYNNNCFNICPEGTHLLYYIEYLCIIDCSDKFPFEKNNECLDYCSGLDFFNKICRISNHTIQAKEYIINTIINEITHNLLDNLINILNEENSDIIIKDKNEIYQLTTSFNQNNNSYYDISTINLGECEQILKEKYYINNEQNLIIYKIEYKIADFLIPIIEYAIFHPITKELLNLNYCKNIRINIKIPVTIQEKDIYKHNPFSEYYNDECYPNIEECGENNNPDILFKRKSDFNNKYLSLCENNCEYNGYDNNTRKVSCKCEIKTKFSLISELLNIKNKLLYNFNNEDTELKLNECPLEEFFKYNCFYNYSIEFKQNIINKIREELVKGGIDKLINNSLFDKREDLLVNQKNIVYQITSTENQKKKVYSNISIINLKECENKLKSHYNIGLNKSLIIFKIDDFIDGIKIPIVEYEIYHPDTKEVLDLNICKNSPIEISYSVSINEDEIFKYDTNSDYYNDKCFPYTTEYETDITLNDRKNEYNNNNLSLCESECSFVQYDKEKKRALCECKPKTIFEELKNIEIGKDKLLSKFIDFDSTTNFAVILCYKIFFCLKGIIINIGSYILIIIIIINIICVVIFYKKGYKEINDKIEYFKEMNYENKNKLKDKISQKKFKKYKKKKKISNKNIFNINKINVLPKKEKMNLNTYSNNNGSNLLSINSSKSKYKLNIEKDISIKNEHRIKSKNKINYFIDKEINSFKYEEALKYDKRTYIQYYISLLKIKHLLIFCFITKNDYNSRIIKICLFFFSFALLYTINSFFFQDNSIHKIYEDKGTFDFIYQIPQIIYSTVISAVINLLIKYLSLSDSNIISLKKCKNIEDFSNINKCIKLKIIIFNILDFLLLLLFWYYLGCFCAVFQNTQFYLIKDTLLSFLLSFIYPFFLNLFPGFFRIPALRKNKKCFYKIDKIIQLI